MALKYRAKFNASSKINTYSLFRKNAAQIKATTKFNPTRKPRYLPYIKVQSRPKITAIRYSFFYTQH